MLSFMVYVGTYTHTGSTYRSEGIYVYRMDAATGILTFVGAVAGIINPSFLAISADCRFLYAVNELFESTGETEGELSAFAIDSRSGLLNLLNVQGTRGTLPCYVHINPQARLAFVANYGSGSVTVLPIAEDGRLEVPIQIIEHHGSSINMPRQAAPHVHSILLDSAARYALVTDFGIDKIVVYQLDRANAETPLLRVREVAVPAGSGPRHMAFHPNGRFLYVVNELSSTVTAFAYHQTGGTLAVLQNVTTLPEDFTGTNLCGDIHVAPSGAYLYVSNRGHDSMSIFAIDHTTGHLTIVGFVPTQGRTPRNFAFDPTGSWLLVTNQDSNTVVQFKVDRVSGQLTPTGQVVAVPTPSFVTIIALDKR